VLDAVAYLEDFEKGVIVEALEATRWIKIAAAKSRHHLQGAALPLEKNSTWNKSH
jgi:hypothetical protein